jgi:hypothetical protein
MEVFTGEYSNPSLFPEREEYTGQEYSSVICKNGYNVLPSGNTAPFLPFSVSQLVLVHAADTGGNEKF